MTALIITLDKKEITKQRLNKLEKALCIYMERVSSNYLITGYGEDEYHLSLSSDDKPFANVLQGFVEGWLAK
jgi:hypothetical protein